MKKIQVGTWRLKSIIKSPLRKKGDAKLPILLDDRIQVEEVRNDRGRVLSRFVRFNLNKALIKKILKARSRGKRLSISGDLLTELRYCTLSDGENHKRQNRFSSNLTFCTYYEDNIGLPEEQLENIVMCSAIGFDGDIIHQIRRDRLENPKECLAIATAHYWLIEQLLSQLRLKETPWLNVLSWALSLVMPLAILVGYISGRMPFNPLSVLIGLAIACLWQISINYLLPFFALRIRRWIWRQLLLRFLSPQPLEKKIAKGMLKRFVP